jgi:hypothetical protein
MCALPVAATRRKLLLVERALLARRPEVLSGAASAR